MRSLKPALVVALIAIAAAPLSAQTNEPTSRQGVTYDLGGGMSRYGPHAFGGLELSMNRWLALRGEALYGFPSRNMYPGTRFTSVALAGVLSFRPNTRVSPYLLGGYALSASQGYGLNVGPLGAAGMRFRIGKVQPFIELRAQHRIGVPMSIGVRF